MKIFCIGFNKTGTTSLSALLSKNGISVAPQIPFESNLESYFCGNYSTFISMIKNDYKDIAFFQDVLFHCLTFTRRWMPNFLTASLY